MDTPTAPADLHQPGRPVDLRDDGTAPRSIDDEHALLAVAREHHRWGQGRMGPVLLRHADVSELLHDPTFEQMGMGLMEWNGVTSGPLHEWWGRIMFANEGERHARLRSTVRGWLTPRRVAELAGPVEIAVRDTLAGLSPGEAFDFADRIASPVPIVAICALLGVEIDDVRALGDATTEVGMAFGEFDGDERARIEQALEVLLAWGDDALATARPETLARAIADDAGAGRIDHDEAVALIANLLFAAHDTTRFLLANTFWELGRNPTVWQEMKDGAVSAADVVEETLRFQPPATGTARIAKAPAHIAGADIAAGDLVSVSLWSASRDPRVYDDADRFVPGRPTGPPLSFGHGVHYCVGAALARMEATVAVDTVVRTCPELSIDSAAARPRTGSASITGIEHLPAVR